MFSVNPRRDKCVYQCMQTRFLASTALLAFSSLLAHAQGTPPTPPTAAQIVANQVARLTKLLDLSTMQQTQATEYFTAEQNTLSTIRTAMHTARTAIQADIKSGNTTDIATQAGTIGSLTTKEVEAQATASAQFYAILSAEQQSKFETLGPLGGGFGGPGGPGGLGPHGTH
jgi:Spy/CpxP family protein refolding chaperone